MDLSPARRRDEEVCTIHVYFHDGTKAGMCWGRDKEELTWLATMLRQALHVPPVARGWFLRSAVAWERAGSAVATPFAGVHIVEAAKQVYRAVPARRERIRLIPTLEPALAPSAGGA